MPIFQGGRLVGNLRSNEAATAAAYYTYQQTILNALQETESYLVAFSQDIATSMQLYDAVVKYRKVVALTNKRFSNGLVSVTDLLDSERQWNSAEQNLLTSETAALTDLISLYKALGGGWQPKFCLSNYPTSDGQNDAKSYDE